MRLAIPSKGELDAPTTRFLEDVGLGVARASDRQYTGTIPALAGSIVLLQRAADIAAKVEDGSADLGITGLDSVEEFRRDGSDLVVVHPALGYGHCRLVLAVPDGWLDCTALADLADVAVELRESGRSLRIATKFPRLVQRFLMARGIHWFSLVAASGAMEAAPTMGYADIIADLTASGTTLRENRLRALAGGTILEAQACLVGSRRALQQPLVRAATEHMLELIEARRRARDFTSITANVRGGSAAAVAAHVTSDPAAAGLQGPTVAPVFDKTGDSSDWYAVTVAVPAERVLAVVAHFRSIGGAGVTVTNPRYLFGAQSDLVARLAEVLEGMGQ